MFVPQFNIAFGDTNLLLHNQFLSILFSDGFLNEQEFDTLLKQLFSKRGEPYTLSKKQTTDIFKLIDENQVS